MPAGDPGRDRTSCEVTANNGQSTVNGLTFHVLGTGYNPTVREVGPGRTYATIQGALDAAFDSTATTWWSSTRARLTSPTRGATREAPTTRT